MNTTKYDIKFVKLDVDIDNYLALKKSLDDNLILKGIEFNFISQYSYINNVGERIYYFKIGDFDIKKSTFLFGISFRSTLSKVNKVIELIPTNDFEKYFISKKFVLSD